MMPERCFHHQTALPSLVLQLVPPWSDLLRMDLDRLKAASSVQTALEVFLNSFTSGRSQPCLHSSCSFPSKSNVLSVAVIRQPSQLWTPCNLNSCFEMPECLTMLRSTNDARQMLSSSNRSAITRPATCASMVGLAPNGSCSFVGSKFSADSSRSSSECLHNW